MTSDGINFSSGIGKGAVSLAGRIERETQGGSGIVAVIVVVFLVVGSAFFFGDFGTHQAKPQVCHSAIVGAIDDHGVTSDSTPDC